MIAVSAAAVHPARLPAPTGPFPVGTLALQTSRRAAQLWYPAVAPVQKISAPYRLSSDGVPLKARIISAITRTDAFLDADIAPGRHPLLIYYAGWGGSRVDNTSLLQDLASHGFVVIAFDDASPDEAMDFRTEAAYRHTLDIAEAKLATQLTTARELLDRIERHASIGEAGDLASHVDMARVGALGFSFGGAAAAELARDDVRVRAAVNLDGWLFGAAARRGVPKPFLVFGTTPDGMPEGGFVAEFDAVEGREIEAGLRRFGGYVVNIRGANHFDFSDAPLLPSLRHTGQGPIGPRIAALIARYTLAFFDDALNGERSSLLASRPIDPAVNLTVWPRPRCRPRRASGPLGSTGSPRWNVEERATADRQLLSSGP